MPAIRRNGAEIQYTVFGKGEDTLIFVPGLGAHSRIWGPFPKMFAETRRIITYDPRGFGKSTTADEELTLELMATDVKAVLEDAGIEKTSLLGASMGALVCLRFALDYPGTVSKLVLVTPTAIRSRYGNWLLETLGLLSERLAPEEYVRTLMPLAFAPSFFEKGFGMIKEVSKMLAPNEREMEQTGRQLACMKNIDIGGEISRIEAPTLIIAGERDVLAPIEAACKLAAKLRHSRLISLPDVGHSPFVEATEAVVNAIKKFL